MGMSLQTHGNCSLTTLNQNVIYMKLYPDEMIATQAAFLL